MADIQDRTKENIFLTSPDSDGNQVYVGKWIGDPITKVKKLGLFDSPKVKGTIVQDLEVKGDLYQLTIYFDGLSHDLISQNFWSSLDAKGTWEVDHPTKGIITLNLSRAVWENEPVRSLGFTTFNTNWIEPLPESFNVSTRQIESTLNFYIDTANESAQTQFVPNVKTDTFAEFNALVSSVSQAIGTIKSNLKKFENLQIIDPRLAAIFDGIASTISDITTFDGAELFAQFTDLYESIGLAQNNAAGAVDVFTGISEEQDEPDTEEGDTKGKNRAAVYEMNLSLANTSIAGAVTLPGIESRTNAVGLASALTDWFGVFVNALDTIQVSFNDSPIENQYIAQSASFGDQVNANRQAILFLLQSSVNLKVERVFTTPIDRATIEIAWTELGGPGEIIERDNIFIDENFYNFCEWNNLHGNDLVILPGGREVRVFV